MTGFRARVWIGSATQVFVGPAEGGAVAGVANMGLEPPLTTRLVLSHLKNRILRFGVADLLDDLFSSPFFFSAALF